MITLLRPEPMSLNTAFSSVRAKIALFIVVGLGSYMLLTLAVVLFYPDDSEQMTWVDREAFNLKVISKYSANSNLTQDSIIERLGSPDITVAMKTGRDTYQILYYRTHRNSVDGITTADECTALLLKNRQLIAIGDAAVSQYQSLAPDGS